MAKHVSNLLELGKRGAERRFAELLDELGVLIGSFPHLSDAFDADELPVSFIINRDAHSTKVTVVRRDSAAPAAARTVVSQPMKRGGRKPRRGE